MPRTGICMQQSVRRECVNAYAVNTGALKQSSAPVPPMKQSNVTTDAQSCRASQTNLTPH